MNKFTLTQTKPIFKLFAGVGIILVIIITVTLLNSKERQPQVYTPSPLPTIQPVKLTQPTLFQSELSKILQFLPYKQGNFSIEFQKEVNILSIKITADSKDDYREAKTKAESFIKSKGVQDICALNIFWVPQIKDSTIRKSLETPDYYATGCQPTPLKKP